MREGFLTCVRNDKAGSLCRKVQMRMLCVAGLTLTASLVKWVRSGYSEFCKGDSMAKKEGKSKVGSKLTRRQFIKLAGASAVSAGALSWRPLFAAQTTRKRIVIHGERQVTSLGYHNRRETEHVSMVDAGLVTQNPVTLERVPVLAEELPSIKKGTWKIDTQKKTMITVYRLRPNLKWHDGKPYTSKDFEFGWQIAKHPEFPMPDRLVPEMIAKIETPDDRTIV